MSEINPVKSGSLGPSNSNSLGPSKSNSLGPTKSNSLGPVNSGNKKVYYSTGRGGAGNIKTGDELPSPKLVPQGSNTPMINQNKFSTGRGGFGNIVKNDDPELTRKLQDVDGKNNLQPTASAKTFSVGRGGAGNVITQQKSNMSHKSDEANLYTISSHGAKTKKKGFLGKVKEIFGA